MTTLSFILEWLNLPSEGNLIYNKPEGDLFKNNILSLINKPIIKCYRHYTYNKYALFKDDILYMYKVGCAIHFNSKNPPDKKITSFFHKNGFNNIMLVPIEEFFSIFSKCCERVSCFPQWVDRIIIEYLDRVGIKFKDPQYQKSFDSFREKYNI